MEVRPDDGEPRSYKAGEAFLECVNRWHQALNTGDAPAKILVVSIGEEGKQTTMTE